MAATTTTTLQNGRAALELARRVTLKMMEGIPPEKACHQPVPGANHVLWVMGHLAGTDSFFLTVVSGRQPVVPGSWEAMFGMGSKPVADLSAYPPLSQVKAVFEDARRTLLEWFSSLDENELEAPPPEKVRFFGPTVGGLLASIAWHEGLHAGQLSAVRRSLGLPSALGG